MSAGVRDVAGLAGVDLGTRTVEYTARDAILYALAVGARASDLDLVYERDLRVLPTYGMALGLWAVEAAGDLGAYDRLRSLHAAQRLEVRAPLPRAGAIEMSARVSAVWDKGKAAMVDIEVECPYFAATYSIFLPGLGGWGGERGQSVRTAASSAAPTEIDCATSEDLAALYRLTGDRHPVHIDPATAADYGFTRPILHGLCTLGIAVRAVAAVGHAHPGDLSYLEARLASPVYPGDTLRLNATAGPAEILFHVRVGDTAVLGNGRARFKPMEA